MIRETVVEGFGERCTRCGQENFAAIRREAVAVLASGEGWEEDYEGLAAATAACDGGSELAAAQCRSAEHAAASEPTSTPHWRKFVLSRWSYPNDANLRRCPATAAVLRSGPLGASRECRNGRPQLSGRNWAATVADADRQGTAT